MKKKLIVLSGFVLALAPVVVFAQSSAQCPSGISGSGSVDGVFGALCKIQSILNAVIPVLVTLGVVYFVYGVITYVISSDEEAKKTGRDRIIYGIIGLAVIIGMWGLVSILTRTFGVDSNNGIRPDQFPTVPIQ
jgi:hypothetical protein